MGDTFEDVEVDTDACDSDILNKLFNHNITLTSEKAVFLKKSYVNKICGSKSLKVAVVLGDNTIELYSISKTSINKYCKLSGHNNTMTDIAFNPENDNLLYSASLDGTIKLWDSRSSGMCVSEYKEENDKMKPLESFDISCNGKVLCGGTQQVEEDAFLIFWDHRKPQPLGGYWNSHSDDITQVRFHAEHMDRLSTGSVDGLINIFNISEQTEEDALLYSLNVENSVERLTWLGDNNIFCCTQSDDVQLWNTDTGDMQISYDREDIAKGIKRTRHEDCYVVNAFRTKEEKTIILAGSKAEKGNCLRSVEMNNNELIPYMNFKENKQVVRCSWYDKERNILVTAGESGFISVWEENASETEKKPLKTVKAIRGKNRKPY